MKPSKISDDTQDACIIRRSHYGEAKSAVDYVTAGLIGSFIILSGVLAAQ